MTDYRQARMRDGSAYAGHTQFLGNGRQRSCAKCARFKAEGQGQFKQLKPYGLCCAACRGERQALREAA